MLVKLINAYSKTIQFQYIIHFTHYLLCINNQSRILKLISFIHFKSFIPNQTLVGKRVKGFPRGQLMEEKSTGVGEQHGKFDGVITYTRMRNERRIDVFGDVVLNIQGINIKRF